MSMELKPTGIGRMLISLVSLLQDKGILTFDELTEKLQSDVGVWDQALAELRDKKLKELE